MPTMTIEQMIAARTQELNTLKMAGQEMARRQEVAKVLAAEPETPRMNVMEQLKHNVKVAEATFNELASLGAPESVVCKAMHKMSLAYADMNKEIARRNAVKVARRQASELAFMNRNREILNKLQLDLHCDYIRQQENLKLRQRAVVETCSLVVEGDMPCIEEVDMPNVNDVKAEVIRIAQQVFLAETLMFKDMWETFRSLEGDEKETFKKMILEEVAKFEKQMQAQVDSALAEVVHIIDQLGLDVETPTKKRLVSLFWSILKREHRHAFMVRRNVQKREKTEKFDRKVDTISKFSIADNMFKALGY